MLHHQLQPAAHVLECLGVRKLARQLGLSAATVSNWNRPPGTSEATNSGTGGHVPSHYWHIIAELAAEAGYGDTITPAFLASRPYPEVGMTGASKLKGDRYEREMVGALNKAGLNAQRVPMSGSIPGYPGDVYLHLPQGRTVLCQCKISKNGEGYGMINKLLRQACLGKIETDGDAYFAMHFSSFVHYLNGQGEYLQQFCRIPLIQIKGKTFTDAIAGHEILFFRRNREDTYVIVPASSQF